MAKKAVKAKKTRNPLAREITFLVLLVFSILSLLSLFQMCGIFGRGLSSVLFGLMGALAYLFPIYLIVSAGFYIANTDNKRLRHKILYSAGLFWCLCALFQWVVNDTVSTVWDIYTISSASRRRRFFWWTSFFLFDKSAWTGRLHDCHFGTVYTILYVNYRKVVLLFAAATVPRKRRQRRICGI